MTRPILYDASLATILEQASAAYRRRDDDRCSRLLESAISLAPYRIDLRLTLANHRILTNRPGQAVVMLNHVAAMVPYDVDTLFLLAHWSRYAREDALADGARERLRLVRPARAADLDAIWSHIDNWLSLPISDRLPDLPTASGPLAVVTLGYALSPDGSMRPALLDRLDKTLEAARLYPEAILVMSGGVPQSGWIEAVRMRQWLVEHGVPAGRIIEEGASRDLVENIVLCRQILDVLRIEQAIVITSAHNVRRAGAAMAIHGLVNGSRWRVAGVVSDSGDGFRHFADDGRDRFKLYRDAIRAYGMQLVRLDRMATEA